jgi:RNA polymerase sigma factor (sigma-70 family)
MSPRLTDLFLNSQSDERLVALARAGHERAFVAIVERYRRELAAQARRLDSGGRAEDIVQQTLLSAFAALRSGAEVTHLRGWLHQILRYAAIRAASRERPALALDAAPGTTESLEAAVESRMLARNLLSELAELPSRQRDAIVAMSIAGHSRAEVASSMGLTEGAVRQLVHRARATLRTAVTALTPFPLARLLPSGGGAAGADGASELAIGGTVSAGGAMVKLGAIVASGVLATAVVSSHPLGHHAKRSTLHHRGAAAVATPSRQRNGPAAFALSGSVVNPGSGVQASGSSKPVPGAAGPSGRGDHSSGRARASSDPGVARRSPGGRGPSRGGGDGSSGSSGTSGRGGDGAPGGSAGASGTTGSGSGASGQDGGSGSGGDGGGPALSADGGGQSSSSGSSPGGSGTGGGTQSGGGPGPSGGLTAATGPSNGGSGSDSGKGGSDGGSGASSVPGASGGGATSGD